MALLNRRVIVRVVMTGTDQFGRPVPATNVDASVWAELRQDKVSRESFVGGTYGDADRVWRVRYNQAFVDALAAGRTVQVLSGPGDTDAASDVVTGIGEPTESDRRRFLDLLT